MELKTILLLFLSALSATSVESVPDVPIEASLYNCTGKLTSTNSTSHGFSNTHTVENCQYKIRITMQIMNKNKTSEEENFFFVKEVLNMDTKKKLRLLNPLAIRFRQEQVLLGYPLKYLTAVNARATEHVFNYENKKNFTGCDDSSPVNPTCGIKHADGRPVPYSQGFCCYCPTDPSSGTQARGGQSCAVEKSPSPNINIEDYKASAHCLKQNDIWYTVNEIDEPNILHQLFFQVFNKRHLTNGSIVWVALTGEEEFVLGHQNPYQFDENKTIIISHVVENPKEASITIPYKENRLFVPQPLIGTAANELPDAIKKGATEYLVIPKTVIDSAGDVCDKTGLSYEGFALQPDKCDVPRNTCLKNQPLDFWDADIENEKAGKKMSHVLRSFGKPYKDPIMIDKETKDHWLAMEYHKEHVTAVQMDTKADDIIALEVGKHAMIIHAITESTSKVIKVALRIQNAGLVSAEFSVQVVDCGFAVTNTDLETKIVPPQLQVNFLVSTVPGNIQLIEEFQCTVQVSSANHGIVAKRVVLLKPKTRCICSLHCRCACLGSSLKCEPLSVDDFHRAGFRGSLPMLTAKPPHKPWIVKHPFSAFTAIVMIFFILGLVKASFGVCGYNKLAEWGLSTSLYKAKKIDGYKEDDLKDKEVMYDEDGFPIHPSTHEPYKTYTPMFMFLLNVIFCCYFPCNQLFEWMRKKNQHPGYVNIPMEDIQTPENSEVDESDEMATRAPDGMVPHTSGSADTSRSPSIGSTGRPPARRPTVRRSEPNMSDRPVEPDKNYKRGSKPAIQHKSESFFP